MKSFIYSFTGYQREDAKENDLEINGHMWVSAEDREQADILFRKALSGDIELSLMAERNFDKDGNLRQDRVSVNEMVPGRNFSLITLGG